MVHLVPVTSIPSALGSSTLRRLQSLDHTRRSIHPVPQNGSPAGSTRTAGQPLSLAPIQESLLPAPHYAPNSNSALPPGSHSPQSHHPQSPHQDLYVALQPLAPVPSNPRGANPLIARSCAQ